jgi:hypothetical protein
VKTAAVVVMAGVSWAVLAFGVGGCSGSDDGGVRKEDTSPTTPAGGSSSGTSSSGASSSGASSSGASSSGGSSASSTGGSSSGTTPDAGGADAGNCVAKGYPGNEKKIGAYCDNDTACPFQIDPFLVCTAGHDPTNTHLFCTTPCSKDAECGTGAYCMHDTGGAGCVPTQCGGAPGM